MNLFFGMAVLAMFLVAMLLYVSRQNSVLKIKIKESVFLLQQLLMVERHERKNINATLHNELQGDLIAVKNFIYLGNQLKDESQREEINSRIEEALTDAINNAKRLSNVLKPPMIDTDTLDRVAQNYFTSGNLLKGERFNVQIKESGFYLQKEKNHELFRVIKELHHNAVYHGNATSLSLLFSQDKKFYFIEFTDNGKAFNYNDNLQKSKGNGLKKIVLFLKLTNSELIQRNAVQGNHYVLKINREV